MNKVICTLRTLNRHKPVLVDHSKVGDTAAISCESCKTTIKHMPKHVNWNGEVIA